MTKALFEDKYSTVFCGDARAVLAELPEHSVDMVMTSPPYYGLRSYRCEPSIWGGDENCKHEWRDGKTKTINPQQDNSGGFSNPTGRGDQKFTAGTGTTGVMAKMLGRKSILIDVSPDYCAMAVKRLKSVVRQGSL